MLRGIDLSMNTVRRIAAELRPAVFEDLGLAAALTLATPGIRVAHRNSLPPPRHSPAALVLPPRPSLAVFRIFQEILTNVIRHANATTLAVAVDTDPTGSPCASVIMARVSTRNPSLLRTLSASLVCGNAPVCMAGTIEWSARRKGGTTVTVRLPLRAAPGR